MINNIFNKNIFIMIFIIGLIPFSFGLIFLDHRILEALTFVPFAILGSVFLFHFIIPDKDNSWLFKLFIASLLLHFILSFGIDILWPTFEQQSDGAAYGPHAAKVASVWSNYGFSTYEDIIITPVPAPGYIYFSAFTFWVINYNTLYIKILNGVFASFAAIYIYKIGNAIYNEKVAKIGAVLTVFMPSISLWTSQNLKDSCVLFLSVFIFWQAIEISKRNIHHIIFLLGALFVLATVRVETAIGLAIILSITQFIHTRGNIPLKITIGIISVITIGWLLQQLGYGFLGSTFLESRVSLEAINEKRTLSAYGGSAVNTQIQTTSFVGFLLYLPTAVANYLLRPWPWEATDSTLQLATIPESVFIWYPIFIFSIIGLIRSIRLFPSRSAPLWMYIISATVAAAPQYGNLGTAYRHRVQLWPFVFLLAGYGWYTLRNFYPSPHSKKKVSYVYHKKSKELL